MMGLITVQQSLSRKHINHDKGTLNAMFRYSKVLCKDIIQTSGIMTLDRSAPTDWILTLNAKWEKRFRFVAATHEKEVSFLVDDKAGDNPKDSENIQFKTDFFWIYTPNKRIYPLVCMTPEKQMIQRNITLCKILRTIAFSVGALPLICIFTFPTPGIFAEVGFTYSPLLLLAGGWVHWKILQSRSNLWNDKPAPLLYEVLLTEEDRFKIYKTGGVDPRTKFYLPHAWSLLVGANHEFQPEICSRDTNGGIDSIRIHTLSQSVSFLA